MFGQVIFLKKKIIFTLNFCLKALLFFAILTWYVGGPLSEPIGMLAMNV